MGNDMIKNNIIDIEARIQAACDRAGRNRSEVTLIAVSKTKPCEMLQDAYENNMRHFGENKVQELVDKYETLNEEYGDIQWHLIGHLQRNKVKYIVDKVVLIHSVDSIRLMNQIQEDAEKKGILCDILLEVNIAGEDSKFGAKLEEVEELVTHTFSCPNIRLRGLMAIPPFVDDGEENRVYFKNLHQLYVDIKTKNKDNIVKGNNAHTGCDEKFDEYFNILSMGMTGDYEVAIEEGATMVRVGTGIFGERNYNI